MAAAIKYCPVFDSPKPSTNLSSCSSWQSVSAKSSDSTYTNVDKRDGINKVQSFCEELSSPTTPLSQSVRKAGTKGGAVCGAHHSMPGTRQTRPVESASTHGHAPTVEDLTEIAIGPSSLDIYLKFEDNFERCLIGLPGKRAREEILDAKLAQVLGTL